MIQMLLNGTTYRVPSMLKEITIAQAMEVERMYNACPESVIKSWNDPTVEVWSGDRSEEYSVLRAITAYLADVPRAELDYIPDSQIMPLLDFIRKQFVAQINFGLFATDEVEQMECFDFEGERYYLPISESDVNGDTTPLAKECALTWAQATDLMIAQKDGHKYMPLIIAILCRPLGEKYNEQTAKKRAEAFINLPANIMVEVFFCLQVLSNIYRLSTLGALARVAKEQQQGEIAEVQRSAVGKTI